MSDALSNSKLTDWPALSDPQTCGESQWRNLARATAFVNQFCDTCADYHATTAASRLTARSSWSRRGREEMVQAIRDSLRARPGAGAIDIVIAGSADTSILSACAHAAWIAGPDVRTRTSFTVIDRCRTPLELCRDYAAHHQLDVRLVIADLTVPSVVPRADLVVLHSVLMFLPATAQIPFLRRCGSWLKPNGGILLWHALRRDWDGRGRIDSGEVMRRTRALVETKVRNGELRLGEPLDAFLARLDRSVGRRRGQAHQFDTIDSIRGLVRDSGLDVDWIRIVDQLVDMPDDVPLSKPNALALLTRSHQ